MSADCYLGWDELLLIPSCSTPPIGMSARSPDIVLDLRNRSERPRMSRSSSLPICQPKSQIQFVSMEPMNPSKHLGFSRPVL
jgi:hypothetical protein